MKRVLTIASAALVTAGLVLGTAGVASAATPVKKVTVSPNERLR